MIDVDVIDAKLDDVLENPQAWGGVRALEPLVLVLMMCREPDDERGLMRAYRKYLAESLGPSSGSLVDRIPPDEDPLTVATDVLRRFVEQRRSEQRATPIPVVTVSCEPAAYPHLRTFRVEATDPADETHSFSASKCLDFANRDLVTQTVGELVCQALEWWEEEVDE